MALTTPDSSSGLLCLFLFSLTLLSSGLVDADSNFDNANDLLEEAKVPLTLQYGNYGLNGLKRAAGFVGMRGKKDNGDDVNDDSDFGYNNNDDNLAQYIFGPRAARAGFVGMRGKKADESLYEKRAGFVGMRGKKAAADLFPFWFVPQQHQGSARFVSESGFEPSKARRASSGFVGMRGR